MWSHAIQRSVASTSRRSTVRFADLKQRRYWLPLMVFQKIHLPYGVRLYIKLTLTIRI